MLEEHGHRVLRLPPYHCDLNPIELIWGDLKGRVARENYSFKLKDVKEIVIKGIADIGRERWHSCVEHIKKVEADYWKVDGLMEKKITPVVIQLESDGDSSDYIDSD